MKMKKLVAILLCTAIVMGLGPARAARQQLAEFRHRLAEFTISPEAPFVITAMRRSTRHSPGRKQPVQKAVEEKLNVKFENRWVPTGTFTEVFNTTLATNDIPMVISAPSSLSVNPGFYEVLQGRLCSGI
jgi:hypothetical protein